MKEYRVSFLDAREIVLRGEVTNFDGETVEVTCEGSWGRLSFDVAVGSEEVPRNGEVVEVRLR